MDYIYIYLNNLCSSRHYIVVLTYLQGKEAMAYIVLNFMNGYDVILQIIELFF